jgi:hypothetical protein
MFDSCFRPSLARQTESAEGLLPARVVDLETARVGGLQMACYAAVDLVRKLVEDVGG